MKLKKYLTELNELVKERPEILEFEVVYGRDDEGNEFSPVVFYPTLGRYENKEFKSTDLNSNSICLN